MAAAGALLLLGLSVGLRGLSELCVLLAVSKEEGNIIPL